MGRPRLPTKGEEAAIRAYLNLAPNQPWPRCPGKSRVKVAAFEASGDFSHSARDHICDACRCDNVAGHNSGTADLYGIGVKIGHYGTGLCGTCRKSARKATADKLWKEQVRIMQQTGMTDTKSYEVKVVSEANHALATIEANEAITRVRKALEDFDSSAALNPDNWITARGGEPLSDEARAELVMKKNRMMLEHAKTIDQLRKTEFEFSRDLHVPLETLKIWAVEIMNLGQKYCPTRDDYDRFLADFKKIMGKTRNPNAMMAEHEASVEKMPRDANG